MMRMARTFGGTQKGGFQKGVFGGCSPGTKTGTRVRSDVPPQNEKPQQGYVRMFPGTKTGTRVHSPKPPFYETALLSPGETLLTVRFSLRNLVCESVFLILFACAIFRHSGQDASGWTLTASCRVAMHSCTEYAAISVL